VARQDGRVRLSPKRSLSTPASAALLALATACGSGTAPAASSGTGSAVFPVVLTRQGGVAGFLHSAEVADDGHVRLTGHDDGGTCQLEDDTLAELVSVARTATGTATTTAAHPDDLVVLVETPRGSKRLTDAELAGTASVVSRLLDDVLKPPAERTLCR
jgi:hypothetical protein